MAVFWQSYISADAEMFHFGVLQSSMHQAWMRIVCGRIKSDYRYSQGIVYNNYPWHVDVDATSIQKAAIEDAAADLLSVRKQFSGASLADLYDPLAIPPALVKAHQTLDRAVDAAYVASGGKKTWSSDSERVGFLFGLYARMSSLFATAKPRRTRKPRRLRVSRCKRLRECPRGGALAPDR